MQPQTTERKEVGQDWTRSSILKLEPVNWRTLVSEGEQIAVRRTRLRLTAVIESTYVQLLKKETSNLADQERHLIGCSCIP